MQRARIESLFATALVVVAIARIGLAVHGHHPIGQWLIWPVAGYWALAGYFLVGCLGFGTRLLRLVGACGYSAAERVALALAFGTLGLGCLVFLAGLGGALGPAFAWFAPAVGVGLFGRSGFRNCRDGLRDWAQVVVPGRWTVMHVAALALGATVLLAVYLPLLTPDNIQHDARWYHLPIASQYAAQGAIQPFQEGWILGAYPHFSSLLYAWALLLPFDILHRLAVAAHLEFGLFLATLFALPPLLDRVMHGRGRGPAAAVFFLFPGYLTYDSNLSLGADHIAALWAAPTATVCLELWKSLRVRDAVLLGAMCAAAAWTKYSALCLVVPVGLFAAACCVRALRTSGHTGQALGGPLRLALVLAAAFGASFVVLWSPHWLKNWVWYGDPLYPVLHQHLPVRPWNPTAQAHFDAFRQHQVVHGSRTLRGAVRGLIKGLNFGLSTRDYGFHGKRPVFGFLFAAAVPLLPFLRVSARTWLLVGMSVVGSATWYLTYSRDRYMQALLPWMSTVAACALVAAWRHRNVALRIAIAALLTLQLALQMDVYFLRAHVMATDKHPLLGVMNRVASQFPGSVAPPAGPSEPWTMWSNIGRALPNDAKLLVHRQRTWVGVDRPVVTDESAWQAGVDYDRAKSVRALLAGLRRLGVTHILMGDYPYNRELGPATIRGELMLWALVQQCTRVPVDAPHGLYRLPARLNPTFTAEVAVNFCKSKSLPPGTYRVRDLNGPAPKIPDRGPFPVPNPAPKAPTRPAPRTPTPTTPATATHPPQPAQASTPNGPAPPKRSPASGAESTTAPSPPTPVRPLPTQKGKTNAPLAIGEHGCPRPKGDYKALPSREKLRLWWTPAREPAPTPAPRPANPRPSPARPHAKANDSIAHGAAEKIRTPPKSGAKDRPARAPKVPRGDERQGAQQGAARDRR